MLVISNPSNFLVSAGQGSGTGSALDTRGSIGQYIEIATYAASALYTFQVSKDTTAWLSSGIYTATTTTAIISGNNFYPFVRAQVNSIWSGGGNTGSGIMYYGTLT